MRLSIVRLLALLPLLFTACAPDVGIKPLPHVAATRSPEFRQAVGSLLGASFTDGNRIVTLQNGREFYPAMLAAIRSARRTITFETYVYTKGEIPATFAQALAERARAGVKVLVLIDAQGSGKSKKYNRLWEDSGVQLVRYNPAWHPNLLRYNNRTHRKLMVIDGRVAFIGGAGVDDMWGGNADSPENWRDNHYRVTGPAVAQVQGAFADNWLKSKKEILHGADYFPALARTGPAAAAVFFASPQHGSFGVSVLYHLAIGSATKSILIQNAYFVPDKDTVAALAKAARRGVRVQILLPGPEIDQPKVRRASRKRWKPLLEAGAEIYEFQPTMLHSKLLVVDGYFTSVGSANFDNRSLHLNDEANLNVLDAAFAAEQTRIFQRDLQRSRRITLENYDDVPITDKILGVLQAPIEGQL